MTHDPRKLTFFLLVCLLISVKVSAQLVFVPISEVDSINRTYTGKKYPAFRASMLNGKPVNNASLKGKVTLFYFWYGDCPTCKNDVPVLNLIYSEHKNDPSFQVIGISVDQRLIAKAGAAKMGINFPVAVISRRDLEKMNYKNGFPSAVLIGKDGKVVFVKMGSIYYSKRDPNGKNNFYGMIGNALKK